MRPDRTFRPGPTCFERVNVRLDGGEAGDAEALARRCYFVAADGGVATVGVRFEPGCGTNHAMPGRGG
jgi:hypothetical protein